MAWLRLHERVAEDQKVQRLADSLFKFWVNAMCVSKKFGGRVDLEDASWRLRMPETRLVMNLELLKNKKLVDHQTDGTYWMHDWEDWQYETDETSTKRVRRFRERNKLLHNGVSPSENETPIHSVSVSVSEIKETSTKVSMLDPPFSALESVDDWYEIFFDGYWLKKSKEAGRRAFRKHVRTRDKFNVVIAARDAQYLEMMRRQRAHRPYPATWLNGECWNDEVVELEDASPEKTDIQKLLETDTENV